MSGLNVLRALSWAKLNWLMHGFSTRRGGASTAYLAETIDTGISVGELNLGFTEEDKRETVLRNRQALIAAVAGDISAMPALVTVQQVHSAIIHRTGISEAGRTNVKLGDGLMTGQPGLLLGILTADCVPVLLADEEHRAVGAFHAGWRGTEQQIVGFGVNRMRTEFNSRPERLSAVIGPCIAGCCYSVGEDVRDRFRSGFSYADALFREGRRDGVGTTTELFLDLVEANRWQLLDAGLAPENIHSLHAGREVCTYCNPEQFFSYRRSQGRTGNPGRTGRMMSVIGVRVECTGTDTSGSRVTFAAGQLP